MSISMAVGIRAAIQVSHNCQLGFCQRPRMPESRAGKYKISSDEVFPSNLPSTLDICRHIGILLIYIPWSFLYA